MWRVSTWQATGKNKLRYVGVQRHLSRIQCTCVMGRGSPRLVVNGRNMENVLLFPVSVGKAHTVWARLLYWQHAVCRNSASAAVGWQPLNVTLVLRALFRIARRVNGIITTSRFDSLSVSCKHKCAPHFCALSVTSHACSLSHSHGLRLCNRAASMSAAARRYLYFWGSIHAASVRRDVDGAAGPYCIYPVAKYIPTAVAFLFSSRSRRRVFCLLYARARSLQPNKRHRPPKHKSQRFHHLDRVLTTYG